MFGFSLSFVPCFFQIVFWCDGGHQSLNHFVKHRCWWGSCCLSFRLSDLYIVVCPFVLILLTIVLSVRLWLTAFDYHFNIFKRIMMGRVTIESNVSWWGELLSNQTFLDGASYYRTKRFLMGRVTIEPKFNWMCDQYQRKLRYITRTCVSKYNTFNTYNIWSVECNITHIEFFWIKQGPSWSCSWSYGCWIYNYICNQWLSPLSCEI